MDNAQPIVQPACLGTIDEVGDNVQGVSMVNFGPNYVGYGIVIEIDLRVKVSSALDCCPRSMGSYDIIVDLDVHMLLLDQFPNVIVAHFWLRDLFIQLLLVYQCVQPSDIILIRCVHNELDLIQPPAVRYEVLFQIAVQNSNNRWSAKKHQSNDLEVQWLLPYFHSRARLGRTCCRGF